MQPESNDLIEQIIRPLEANAELYLAARSYLLEKTGEAGEDEEGNVAAFVKTRANETPERSASPRAVTSAATQIPGAPPIHWRKWFYLAVLTLLLALSAPFTWQAYEAWRFFESRSLRHISDPVEPYLPFKIRNLPYKERILLLGDESLEANASEKWRPLWKLEPENPVFLAQYAKSYSSSKNALSPEILEAAARIDPNNALYPMLQVANGWNSVIETKYPTPAEKKAGKRKEWFIKDHEELQSLINLIHRALAMHTICGYEMELRSRQGHILHQPKDSSSFFESAGLKSYHSAWFSLQPAPKLLAAKASECAKQGDTEGFHSAVSTWQTLCRMAASGGGTYVEALITRDILSAPLEDFRAAAQQLGLEDDARRFDEFDKLFKQMRTDEKSRLKADPTVELVDQKGSLLFSSFVPFIRSRVNNPPPITAADLRPGRYAEHALFGRFASLAAAVVFLLLAGIAALCRFRQSAVVRAISPSMTEFLRVSDCLWIAGLGVIAPIAWFLTIQFLTPFGVREWSLRFTAMIVPFAQVGAAVLLVVVATLVTAGWRLGVRAAVFGLRGKRQWIGWVMVAILVISIPAIGALPGWMPVQSERMLQFSLGVLLGAPVLWLGISLLLNLVNRADQSLRRATLARLMIPAWIFAAAAFACLIPVYHHSEKHWFKNDSLTGLANPEVEFTRYEAEVAKVFHKELRELMEDRL
jgi:hypothetical protein